MKKKFIRALDIEQMPKGTDEREAILERNLRKWDICPSGVSHKVEQFIRYMELEKNLFLVEVWHTYCPHERGAYGRQRSVLRARYTLRRIKEKDGTYKFDERGIAENYYWSNNALCVRKTFDDKGEVIKLVKLTPEGKLEEFNDTTRGNNNPRIISYNHHNGVATLRRWRGRYRDVQYGHGWGVDSSKVVRYTEDGSPLLIDGNYTEVTIRINGNWKESEVHFIGGRRHGVVKDFNQFGRVIDEKFFHHGVEIPRWVFLKPEDATIEEIVTEDNAEVRRAMLELQGFDVFMARCEAKKMLKIVDQDPDEKVGTLIRIDIQPMTRTTRNERDSRRIQLLKVKDGTLPKHYVLRVPPNMRTARQANAWTWSLKANEYAPAIER